MNSKRLSTILITTKASSSYQIIYVNNAPSIKHNIVGRNDILKIGSAVKFFVRYLVGQFFSSSSISNHITVKQADEEMEQSTIFLLITSLLLINFIIKEVTTAKIQDKIILLITRLRPSPLFGKLIKLKHDQHEIKIERDSISAQDQYAKWTKLNRKFDKLSVEIKNIENEINSSQGSVKNLVATIIKCFTSIPINLLKLWYGRSAMFFIPRGLLPNLVEMFVINMPFVKRGGVSVLFWCYAFNTVLNVVADTVKSTYAMINHVHSDSKPEKKDI